MGYSENIVSYLNVNFFAIISYYEERNCLLRGTSKERKPEFE